jgi:ABC-type transport system involved in multi-copper enzyme maturation permease subunit
MLNPRIWELAVKDIRLHAWSIVATQLSAVGLGWLGRAIGPEDPAADATLLFNINLILAGFWGDWLVSGEKLKGTVAWLRSLPITDFDLVTSKLVAQGFCIVSLWVLSTGLLLRDVHGGWSLTWAALLLTILAFGAVSLGCRWRFRQKAGQLLPFGVVLVPLVVITMAGRLGLDAPQALEALWDHQEGQVIVAVALVTCYGAAWWAALTWVRRSDTSRLVE